MKDVDGTGATLDFTGDRMAVPSVALGPNNATRIAGATDRGLRAGYLASPPAAKH